MSYKIAAGAVLPLLLSAFAIPHNLIGPSPTPSTARASEMGPTPLCSHDSIGLLLSNPANHSATLLFAHQHSDQPVCAQPFPRGAPLLRLEVPLRFLPCGVRSRRLTFPKIGLEYSLRTLLHFTDGGVSVTGPSRRVFDIRCQYFPDQNRYAGQVLELSAHRSGFVVQESELDPLNGRSSHRPAKQPQCKYSIHVNSEESTVAGHVQLGDAVFHRWRCGDEYALKVYRCFVHDGRNRRHQIIDDRGCSTDLSLMPHPVYSANSSNAFAASRVFRFSSSTRVFFDCLLYACLKSDAECRRTAMSNCDKDNAISVGLSQKRLRRKRQTNDEERERLAGGEGQGVVGEEHGRHGTNSDFDLSSQRMTTFVEFSAERTTDESEGGTNQKLHNALLNSQKAVKALVILNVVSLSTAVLLACAFCGQRRRFFSTLSISNR
ncbi:hypothetical protein GPALN_012629 [Globodera pallida]|nr:hypothetical protein GPALN_012629 [Globodera pallida]